MQCQAAAQAALMAHLLESEAVVCEEEEEQD